MRSALILSSHVSANRVGGGAQALALAALGIEPILAPTVLLGRHPGKGAPGGGPVTAETFQGVLDGAQADGAFARADLVICGYFASAAQIGAAARAVDAVRRQAARPLVVVDPIMGDSGKGLYVAQAVADALAAELVPRADILAPNAWELQRLSGLAVTGPASALAAAGRLPTATLASSIPCGGRIGVLFADRGSAWLASHDLIAGGHSGAGDLLVALFAAYRLQDRPIPEALEAAVQRVAAAVANARGGDLQTPDCGGRMDGPGPVVRVEQLRRSPGPE